MIKKLSLITFLFLLPTLVGATTLTTPFYNYRWSQQSSCNSITNGTFADLCEQSDKTLWGCLQSSCTSGQWVQVGGTNPTWDSITGNQSSVNVGGFNNNANYTTLAAVAGVGYQPSLSLIKGNYVDGDMCTYTASGTLINCNTAIPSQTPWTSNINGGGYSLTGVLNISLTGLLNDSSLSASQAVVTDASKNLVSMVYSSANTNSSIVSRDSAGNSAFNNVIQTTTVTVTSGQTVIMNYGNAGYQRCTGTANITYNLPDATYLIAGEEYRFDNDSTGTLTVNDWSGSLVKTVPSGSYGIAVNLDNTTQKGLWSMHFYIPDNGTSSKFVKGDGSLDSNTYITGTGSISGNAATATNISTNGTANQVWGMNAGASAQGWQTATGGSNGDLQMKNGSAFVASHVHDDGSTVYVHSALTLDAAASGGGSAIFATPSGQVFTGGLAGGNCFLMADGQTVNCNAYLSQAFFYYSAAIVSFGTGNGASSNFDMGNQTFKQVDFHDLTGYTYTDNSGFLWDTSYDYFTVADSGYYEIVTKIRVTDGTTALFNYGQGADLSLEDSPNFMWFTTTANTTGKRNGSLNIQINHFNSGDHIMMLVWAQKPVSSDMYASDGYMSVRELYSDNLGV